MFYRTNSVTTEQKHLIFQLYNEYLGVFIVTTIFWRKYTLPLTPSKNVRHFVPHNASLCNRCICSDWFHITPISFERPTPSQQYRLVRHRRSNSSRLKAAPKSSPKSSRNPTTGSPTPALAISLQDEKNTSLSLRYRYHHNDSNRSNSPSNMPNLISPPSLHFTTGWGRCWGIGNGTDQWKGSR